MARRLRLQDSNVFHFGCELSEVSGAMRTLVNTHLDQYFITEIAGRGSMSTVYKGFQPSLNRSVAIKVLYGRLNPQSRLRFEREARAIALLQHPNILPIYDFVQHDEIDYFVMQYVDPPVSLNDRVVSGLIPLTNSLNLISRVLDALDYAHSRGVIHRDIKPSNILLSRDDWPLLADFGIAKMIDDSQELTPVGQVVGTASYMPPEVTRSESVDTRSNIYSIGNGSNLAVARSILRRHGCQVMRTTTTNISLGSAR